MTDFCVEFINGWIIPTEPTEKGGAGSGFWGHAGIVGHQGGSAPKGSGISSQSSAFDVRTVSPDDMVIMHSPFTDEDVVVNFRGLNGDKAAVFNMKSGIQSMIPKEWITGKAESGISSQSGGLPKSTNYKLVDRKTGRIVAEGNRNDMDKLIKKYPKSDVYNLPRSRVGELMQDAPPRVVTPMGARRANYGIWGD